MGWVGLRGTEEDQKKGKEKEEEEEGIEGWVGGRKAICSMLTFVFARG